VAVRNKRTSRCHYKNFGEVMTDNIQPIEEQIDRILLEVVMGVGRTPDKIMYEQGNLDEAEAPQDEPKVGEAPKNEAKATTPVETPKEKLARKIAESKARREEEASKGTQSTLIDETK